MKLADPVHSETALPPAVFAVTLSLIVLAGAGVRLYGIGGQDYWLDELHSLMNSGGRYPATYALPHAKILDQLDPLTDLSQGSGPTDVWRMSQRDVHPPLYFLLLRCWREAFGESEAVTRSLSLLCSVLSLVPLALMLRAMGRPRAGLVAAAILALSFSSIYLAQQSRPYSLGLLLVCAAYWLFVEILSRGAADRRASRGLLLVYALCLLLSMMTHYFTALALAPQLLYTLTRRNRKARVAVTVSVAIAAAAWCAVWGAAFVSQLPAIQNQQWLREDGPGHAWRTIGRTLDLAARLLAGHERYTLSGLRCLAGAIVGLGVVVPLIRKRKSESRLFLLWAAVPVLFLLLTDLGTHQQTLAFIRYTAVVTPALAALVALALMAIRLSFRWPLVTAAFIALVATGRLPTIQNPHAREASAVVASHTDADSLIIYDGVRWPPHWAMRQLVLVSYYLELTHPPFVLVEAAPSVALLDDIERYTTVIIVAPVKRQFDELSARRYRERFHSGYMEGIGYVYVYTRPLILE